MQGSQCSGRAEEENIEKGLMEVLWGLKSSEVGKIYRKIYTLRAILRHCFIQ